MATRKFSWLGGIALLVTSAVLLITSSMGVWSKQTVYLAGAPARPRSPYTSSLSVAFAFRGYHTGPGHWVLAAAIVAAVIAAASTIRPAQARLVHLSVIPPVITAAAIGYWTQQIKGPFLVPPTLALVGAALTAPGVALTWPDRTPGQRVAIGGVVLLVTAAALGLSAAVSPSTLLRPPGV